ncbi:hypothetical protein ACVWXO_005583 [Bradyrhizobium sp. LM2.7]
MGFQIKFAAPKGYHRDAVHCCEVTKTLCQLTVATGNQYWPLRHLQPQCCVARSPRREPS